MTLLKAKLIRVISTVIIVYGLLMGALYFMQRSLMYFPPSAIAQAEQRNLHSFSPTVVLTSDNLALTGYFSAPRPGKPILLFFHGNASHPAWEAFKTQSMRAQGYGVLFAEYRGYGGNPGKPTEAGFYADGEAYLDFLRKQYPDHPVVIYGVSLGSGIAIDLASRNPVVAVILEVPFYSALSIAQKEYWFFPFIGMLMKDTYRNDLKIQKVTAPKLFLLAGRDRVTGLETGLRLYDLTKDPKTQILFPEAGHNDIYAYEAEKQVSQFLEGLFKS